MNDWSKEEWVSFMNDHCHPINRHMMKCPICDEVLFLSYLGSNTHSIPGQSFEPIRNVINCSQCNIEWTKKELFFMAQIKRLEK